MRYIENRMREHIFRVHGRTHIAYPSIGASRTHTHTFQWLWRWRGAYTCSGFFQWLRLLLPLLPFDAVVANRTLARRVRCLHFRSPSHHHTCLQLTAAAAFAWKTNQWTLSECRYKIVSICSRTNAKAKIHFSGATSHTAKFCSVGAKAKPKTLKLKGNPCEKSAHSYSANTSNDNKLTVKNVICEVLCSFRFFSSLRLLIFPTDSFLCSVCVCCAGSFNRVSNSFGSLFVLQQEKLPWAIPSNKFYFKIENSSVPTYNLHLFVCVCKSWLVM